MNRVMLFDRFGNPLKELAPNAVISLTRREEVNGEHSLEIETTEPLAQGLRVLTMDARGIWREHVVYGVDEYHGTDGHPTGTYYCVWSLMHDLAGTAVSAMPGVQTPVTAAVALGSVLSGTSRWIAGTVTNTATGGASMYDMSGWEAMAVLLDNWGGEIDVTIEVDVSGVVSRKVDYYNQQGSQEALRRYDFGGDLKSIRRRIADGPLYCRMSPRGKGEQTEGGGYGRKITIESVNGGKDYLQYNPMVDLAKLPDGNGGWEYPTIIVENSEMETPADLKAWAQSVLAEMLTPEITYEIDVVQAAREGVDLQGVSLGDTVQLVDLKFGDGLRLSGRISEMTVDMLSEQNVSVTIGNASEWLPKAIASISQKFNTVNQRVLSVVAQQQFMATGDYVEQLIGRINEETNATGGYTYITEGQGIRTYDTAVSDPAVGSEASAVVEIKGGTIRIANSKTAQGEWEWKTVFTSGHIAANMVTAANITTGYIGNVSGSYWDLDNNILTIASGANIGDTTVSQMQSNISTAQTTASNASTTASNAATTASNAATTANNAATTASNAAAAASDAAKVATNYLTYSSSSGLDIGYSGTSAKTRINGSGVQIYDGDGTSILSAAVSSSTPTVRIGPSSSGRVTIVPDSISMHVKVANTVVKRFQIGGNNDEMTFGSRKSGTTIGSGSVCLGTANSASGLNSAVLGNNLTASGNFALAVNNNNIASGQSSFAGGAGTTASATNSFAIGDGSTAKGNNSFAGGYEPTATGSNSLAFGTGVNSYADNQVAFGKYNSLSSTHLLVIGKGTGTSARSNAMYVASAGSMWIAGTLTQNSDKRLKEHHAYLGEDACEFVRKLKPALFTKDGERHLGFYAQDVQEADEWDTSTVEPQHTDDSLDYDPLTLEYTALIAPLVAYAQSLEKRIEKLESILGEAMQGETAEVESTH